MSKMKSLALMMAMAAITGDSMMKGNNWNKVQDKDLDLAPKQPPLPKGCKEYFFNINGGFSTEKMLRSEVIFKCVASNEKTARKKFDKWVEQQEKED